MQNGQEGVGDLITTSALEVKTGLPNESTAKKLSMRIEERDAYRKGYLE